MGPQLRKKHVSARYESERERVERRLKKEILTVTTDGFTELVIQFGDLFQARLTAVKQWYTIPRTFARPFKYSPSNIVDDLHCIDIVSKKVNAILSKTDKVSQLDDISLRLRTAVATLFESWRPGLKSMGPTAKYEESRVEFWKSCGTLADQFASEICKAAIDESEFDPTVQLVSSTGTSVSRYADQISDFVKCGISREEMKTPYRGCDGNQVQDKAAMDEWAKKSNKCSFCRADQEKEPNHWVADVYGPLVVKRIAVLEAQQIDKGDKKGKSASSALACDTLSKFVKFATSGELCKAAFLIFKDNTFGNKKAIESLINQLLDLVEVFAPKASKASQFSPLLDEINNARANESPDECQVALIMVLDTFQIQQAE